MIIETCPIEFKLPNGKSAFYRRVGEFCEVSIYSPYTESLTEEDFMPPEISKKGELVYSEQGQHVHLYAYSVPEWETLSEDSWNIQMSRLNHIKTTLDLYSFREYEATEWAKIDDHYIETLLELGQSFTDAVYNHLLSKIISKRMKLSARFNGNWFIGDVMRNIVYDMAMGRVSKSAGDQMLEELYVEFLWELLKSEQGVPYETK